MSQVFPAVKAIIKDKGEFLVIKQIVGDKIYWDLPGGKVDFGESPYDTLHREVKEEVGLEVEIIRPIGMWWFFRSKDGNQIICNTFLCEPKHNNIDLTKNPSSEKISEIKWVTKEEFLTEKYPTSHESLKRLISKSF